MLKDHILLAFLWLLFCIFHSLFASPWFKQKMQKSMKDGYKHYRIYYTIFAFITMVATLYYQLTINTPLLFQTNLFTNIAGGLIALTGFVIMGICIKKYFLSLSGLKTLFIKDHKSELIITGIHKYIRHPLYLGTFIFIWGLFVLFPYLSLLITNVIITGYTLLGIIWEEQKLVEEFGDDYKSYQKNVPKILPFKRKI